MPMAAPMPPPSRGTGGRRENDSKGRRGPGVGSQPIGNQGENSEMTKNAEEIFRESGDYSDFSKGWPGCRRAGFRHGGAALPHATRPSLSRHAPASARGIQTAGTLDCPGGAGQ